MLLTMLDKIAIIVGALVGLTVIIKFLASPLGRSTRDWISRNFRRFIWQRRTLRILVAAIVVGAIVWIGLKWRQQNITGTIYEVPCGDSPARTAVKDVTVFISERRDLKSEPTGLDGVFTIKNVPIDLQPTQLTAQLGEQYYPLAFRPFGDYAIIPRPCPGPRIIREIDAVWKEANAKECLIESKPPTRMKRYLLNAFLPGEQGKTEAFVTLELLNAVDTIIVNAFVLSPSQEFYRNETVRGQDRQKAHTWKFELPKDGQRISLELCLGSNSSAAPLSKDRIHDYYELR